jgi:hypothetical protein
MRPYYLLGDTMKLFKFLKVAVLFYGLTLALNKVARYSNKIAHTALNR